MSHYRPSWSVEDFRSLTFYRLSKPNNAAVGDMGITVVIALNLLCTKQISDSLHFKIFFLQHFSDKYWHMKHLNFVPCYQISENRYAETTFCLYLIHDLLFLPISTIESRVS